MRLRACRLCFEKENLIQLFGRRGCGRFTTNQIFLATGVLILPHDDLPQLACLVCMERLRSAIHLRKISTQTQKKLKLLYTKPDSDISDKLLYEIDNFKTDDEDLNKLLGKISMEVCQVVNSSINCDTGQPDNLEIIRNDNFMADSNLDNKTSECSQVDNCEYKIEFDHNYYRKSTDLSVVFKKDEEIKNRTNNLGKITKVKETKMEAKEILNTSDDDNKLRKKLQLLSKLNKNQKYSYFKSNPAMLPAKQFKLLFAKNSTKILKKEEHSNNVKKNSVSPSSCNKTIIKVRKSSQPDNKISLPDNKISLPDNKKSHLSDNSDNHYKTGEDFQSFIETDDWYKNQLKETKVQKDIDKRRLEKFMSLAVTRVPVDGRLQCRVCLVSLLRGSFVSHAKLHFPPEFACETCGKMFYTNTRVYYHRQRMHGLEKPLALACPHCDYRAVLTQDLTEHMRLHTGERPFVCDVCGLSFRLRLGIVQHMRTHFGVKKIQCPRCPNKWFRCRSDLSKHKRYKHHDFKYFCHLCPKTYLGHSGRCSLRKHLAKVHGIPRSAQPVKLKYTMIAK